MAYLISGVSFIADNIRLDDGIHAAADAYELVRTEGIPFSEAYRRVAGRYAEE